MFEDAMRRVIAADDAGGKSLVILDGPPSAAGGPLHAIWHDLANGALDPRASADLGPGAVRLSPDRGHVNVMWFTVDPLPDDAPPEALRGAVREMFSALGAERHLVDQARHPAMHETDTLDIVCVLAGDVSLILEGGETRLRAGNVVIQRGTNHAWHAHGAPALLLGVLIDRDVAR